ncbi:MAG: MaoC family dehydratase [Pseudomonadota bacterium]|nr:MaoC family dehydratase [Pseudomonadota bacterium]
MATRIDGKDGLLSLSGTALGSSEWATMTYERIVAFADATGDHQWIHVDRERIAKESPYGAPIAHGYLTLSLVAGHFFDVLELAGFAMIINYGANKVRFPSPLKEGDRYRLSLTLGEVKEAGAWYEAIFLATIEIEGGKKPACVAECVYRLQPAA